LLFDVLHATFSICLKLQNEYNSWVAIVPPLMCEEFDAKLEILYVRMAHEAICVLQPFLDFCDKFDASMVHNMLALILDPKIKTLKCVTTLIRRDKAQTIVDEYDSKILFSMVVMMFKCLNLSPAETPPPQTHVENESLFGAPASSEEVSGSLLKFELFLFRQVVIPKDDLKDPLA
jgi:hypothetical protein